MRYPEIVPAVFVSRPNRFIAYVDIDGIRTKVHVKNTGRCKEILVPGAEVFLCPGDNPARSTPYDLVAVRKGRRIINIDSQAPNKIAFESVEDILGPCDYVKPEYTLGDSRFDIYAECNGRKVLMEVKGVTLEFDDEVFFPDAPTERGLKHVRELTRFVREDYRCVVCFIIQMYGVKSMGPNYRTHAEFGYALEEAEKAGVEILAFECRTTADEEVLTGPVPVILGKRP